MVPLACRKSAVSAITHLSTGSKVRELAAFLTVPGTAIGIGKTGAAFLTTAIGIGSIRKRITIVVHTVGAVRFRKESRCAAVHRAVALVLARIASAIAAAVRDRLSVVANPSVRVAAGVRAVHVRTAAVSTARAAFLLTTAVGGARQTILAVVRLADSITTRLRSIVADTIVRATVTVFS